MNPLSEFLSTWTQEALSRSVLHELGWLLLALALAWLIVKQLSRYAAPASVLFGRQLVDGLLFPAVALGLVYIGQIFLGKQQSLMLLKFAVPVLLSLVLIRLCARVLTAVFPQSPLAVLTERLISWLAWLVAVLWITDLLPLVAQEMAQIHFNFGKTRIDLRSLVEGLLSSGLVLVLALWLSATIEQRVLAQTMSDLSMRKIASNVLRAVLLLIGLLLALSAVGVDLTALSVLGGALGVGLGLGLQKLAANYVSGFVVLVERSVRIGDVIRVDGMEGTVTDIKTRYTLLRDANGRETIIPNDMLITQRVDNFSLTQSAVALQCPFTVALDSDPCAGAATLVHGRGQCAQGLARTCAAGVFQQLWPRRLGVQPALLGGRPATGQAAGAVRGERGGLGGFAPSGGRAAAVQTRLASSASVTLTSRIGLKKHDRSNLHPDSSRMT
jgi:small-conductance mechanosensitive channel